MVNRVVIKLNTLEDIRESRKKVSKIRDYYADRRQLLRNMTKQTNKMLRGMVRELKVIPPKRSYPSEYPIKYTSPAQFKKVMAITQGKPHKRTGDSNEWKAKARTYRDRVSAKVSNESDYYQYLRGEIGFGTSRRSIKRYLKPMQEWHKRTGYKPAYEIVQRHNRKIRSKMRKMVTEWAGKATERF